MRRGRHDDGRGDGAACGGDGRVDGSGGRLVEVLGARGLALGAAAGGRGRAGGDRGMGEDVGAGALAAGDGVRGAAATAAVLAHLALVGEAFLAMLFHGGVFELADGLVKHVAVGSEPAMVLDPLEAGAVDGVGLEHEGEELASVGGDVLGEGERGVDDVLVEEVNVVAVRVGGVVVKGKVAGEHGIEDDAAGPDVDGGADVGAL